MGRYLLKWVVVVVVVVALSILGLIILLIRRASEWEGRKDIREC